jgi:hypothetical protein
VDLLFVGLMTFAAYWVGWAVGRSERPDPPPWPEAEDCEPLSPLVRRILPYLPTQDGPSQGASIWKKSAPAITSMWWP